MADERLVGAEVRAVTVQDEVITGLVYCLDEATSTLVIRQPNSKPGVTDPNLHDFRVVKLGFLRSCEVVARPTAASRRTAGEPSYVDLAELRLKENKAVAQARHDVDDVGMGVTAEGQAIFNSLKKALDKCRWQQTSIIVHDVVQIVQPYTEADCSLLPGESKKADQTLKRVRDALGKIRSRLASEAASSSSAEAAADRQP